MYNPVYSCKYDEPMQKKASCQKYLFHFSNSSYKYFNLITYKCFLRNSSSMNNKIIKKKFKSKKLHIKMKIIIIEYCMKK